MAYVGDVHNMGNIQTGAPEYAAKHVVDHIGPEVSDVGVIVYRRAAAVESRFSRDKGFKYLQLPCKGII
jgi:hypothetical protein